MLAIIALILIANAVFGIYHAGAEWKFWPGPTDCSGPVTNLGRASDLTKQLRNVTVVRCDEAAWRFLGLLLAGYNVLAGGGMGMSHGNTQTYPRLADVVGFIFRVLRWMAIALVLVAGYAVAIRIP